MRSRGCWYRCRAVRRAAGALFLTWTTAAGAQTTVPRANSHSIAAVRAMQPPVIDGEIGEDEWNAAAVATDFIQFEPRRGDPSQVRTEALVLYDAGHLYVAFRAWDAEPITAQLTQRDADLGRDDSVAVVLDTTFDRRSGYYFLTNALGTQADGRIAEDGRISESSFDAPWQSAARRTDYGWSAEFSLPLSSVRYAAGKSQVWGINFGRSRGRTLEVSYWSGPLDSQTRVSQAGRLTELDVPPPLDRIQIVPYGLMRAQDGMAPHWEGGVDARYALTPSTAVYATLFPDFATIEADQEQINLTRFELSLPEKRQFFLEGQEQFNQRYRTFYSRRIEDIAAGGKLLGKQGPWTMVFLSAESDPSGDEGRANYTVARAQRDVSGRSTVAVMGANRRFEGKDQGSVSADANLFFTRTFSVTAQAVESYGRFGRGSALYYIRPSYDSPTAHFHVRYGHIGDRVADNLNVIGQIVDDDRREIDSHVTKILWIRGGAFEKLQHDANYQIYWGQTGLLRSWKVNESLAAEFRNRLSAEISWIEEFKRFEKDFRNREAGIELGYNTREYQSVKTGVKVGRNFDADFVLWTASARYKVTPDLSAEYSLERLELNPDPQRQSTWIHVLRADQFFTKDLFLRFFFQTNSAIDRNNVQALLVYRYLPPFGTIQVAYQRGTAAFGQRSTQGNTIFLKATTVF
ncbi:MAG: Carb-bd dom fam9 protein [Acidobacteria bacterium]|nr:Carb-bd dom fam9 protein [Acidobacteriota bacterium]